MDNSASLSSCTSGYAPVAPTPTVAMASETPDEAAVIPRTWRFYANILMSALLAIQFGWSASQLNNSSFHNEVDCGIRPVVAGTCVMFPGHTSTDWTLAVCAWLLGGFIGSLSIGRLANTFGRKPTLMANCVVMLGGAAVQATARTITIFSIGRIVAGIAAGGSMAVIPGFLHELCPPSLRSQMATCFQLALSLGHVFVALAFFFASTRTGWRYIAGAPAVLGSVVLVVAPLVLVESPAWLMTVNRPKDAEKELARLFGQNHVHTAKKWIPQQLGDADVRRGGAVRMLDLGLATIAARPNAGQPSPIARLFTSLRPQMLTALGMAGAQQLMGTYALVFYSSRIFNEAGISDPRISVLIVTSLTVLATLVCGVLTARVGIQKLLLYGTGGMFLGAVGLTVSLVATLSLLSTASVALYVASFSASMDPLAWGVIADLFPDDVRAVGCSLCVACSWLCSLAVALAYPYLADALAHYSFVPFVYTITLSFLFLFALVPETYGKTIQDIQDEFGAMWQRPKAAAQWRMSGGSQIPVLG